MSSPWRLAGALALVAGLVAVPVALAQGQAVTWKGNGATGGSCNTVEGSGTTQSWPFVLTSPFDGSGSTLSATFSEPGVAVAASLVTNLAGDDNDLVFTANVPGSAGNAISIEIRNPEAASSPLSVTTSGDGKTITIDLATDATGVVTSTALQVGAAVNTDPAASSTLTATLPPGDAGTGVMAAMARTYLAGGADDAPVEKTYTAPGTRKGNGPYQFAVTTPSGAQLLSASATNGTARSNLNVGRCSRS